MFHAIVFLLFLSRVHGRKRHVFFAIGGHDTDLTWVDRQYELYGVLYQPVFVNPSPRVENLRDILAARGGFLYENAAWTADNMSVPMYVGSDPLYKGGFDSMFALSTRHAGYLDVRTVDLARVVKEHTDEEDVIVMRMDVEGSEYELLRHLLVQGLLCRLSRLYLETHAMTNPALFHFRTFDVLLPWLLAPCGTEVFVDSHYHSIFECTEVWVKDDGACRECPLLYATLPGVGTSCPSTALQECFDTTFTCERCCEVFNNTWAGVRGDRTCWNRASNGKDHQRLSSGGRAYPVPDDVLKRLGARSDKAMAFVESLAGEEAGRPPIFSYEMCCAGMLGHMIPELNHLVAQQGEYEAYSLSSPKFSKDVQRCSNVNGIYQDSGGGFVSVVQSGCNAQAANELQRWTSSLTVQGQVLQMWDLKGTVNSDSIFWSHGATWTRMSA